MHEKVKLPRYLATDNKNSVMWSLLQNTEIVNAMKRISRLIFLLLIALAPFAFAGGLSADAERAIAGLKAFNSGWNDVTATLDVTSDGKGNIKQHGVARMKTTAKADNSQKIVIRVESPPGAKGTGFLSHIDSTGNMKQWLFIPTTGRVMEVQNSGRSGAFLGTEFTFEDLAVHPSRYAVADAEEEDCMVDGKELDCQVITLNPAPGTSSYTRLDAWVDEKENRLRKVDFYKKDKMVKTLSLEKYGQFDGKHWIPQSLTMKNSKTERHTVLLWQDVKFNNSLGDDEFVPEKLAEGAVNTKIGPR